ncbi:TetR/AcrR family transcriptional regulator [Nocardia sp. NPDC057663]|uniref:TetR/AcrR family transcriptional regulator n=1 Tax=Nocardia sp. NPDC057663 TaxID=3346201 RepID=UPI00366D5CBE
MTQPTTSNPPVPLTRRRNGKTAAERQSERRQLLIDTTFEIIDNEGATAVTVRELSRRTGLTARYFYESFAGRDEMLRELFDAVADDMVDRCVAAIAAAKSDGGDIAEALARSFIDGLIQDRSKARLFLYEPLVETALSGGVPARASRIARIIHNELPDTLDRTERALVALDLVGTLATVLSSWLTGAVRATREQIIAHCVRRFHESGIGTV